MSGPPPPFPQSPWSYYPTPPPPHPSHGSPPPISPRPPPLPPRPGQSGPYSSPSHGQHNPPPHSHYSPTGYNEQYSQTPYVNPPTSPPYGNFAPRGPPPPIPPRPMAHDVTSSVQHPNSPPSGYVPTQYSSQMSPPQTTQGTTWASGGPPPYDHTPVPTPPAPAPAPALTPPSVVPQRTQHHNPPPAVPQQTQSFAPPATVSDPFSSGDIPTAASFASPWTGLPAVCPGSLESVPLPGAKWHTLSGISVPNFLICNRCYEVTIRRSRFASEFTSVSPKPANREPTCRFFTHRSRRVWAEALKTGDLGPFRAYALVRGAMPSCAGEGGVAGGDPDAPPKWYGPSAAHLSEPDSLQDFIICSACYEDEMVGTQAEHHLGEFRTIGGLREGNRWICGYTQLFSRAVLLELAQGSTDWRAFVNAIRNRRNTVCTVPGKGVKPTSSSWFRVKPAASRGSRFFSSNAKPAAIDSFLACGSCYLDYVCGAFKDEVPGIRVDMFEQMPTEEIAAIEKSNPEVQFSCDMGHPAIILPVTQLLYRPQGKTGWDDEAMWKRAVEVFLTDSCFQAENNVIRPGGEVYKLRGASANLDFDICASCYMSYGVCLGIKHFFVKAPRPSEGQTACDMGVRGNARLTKLFTALISSQAMNDSSIFERYIRERYRLPACPKSNRAQEGQKSWYGTGLDFVCCPECYLDVVKGSPLEGSLTMHNVFEPNPLGCMLYSPRARRQWSDACASGSLNTFIASQASRRAVYAQVIPRLAAMHVVFDRRIAEYNRLMQRSRELQGLGVSQNIMSMNSHSMSSRIHTWSVSYTGNDGHAQLGASFHRQADDAMRQANSMVLVTEEEKAEEAELLKRWAEVE